MIEILLYALLGSIAFAQGFTGARARRQKHNPDESENRATAAGE